eukprot:4910534-Prymnesium_polylepis.2
MLSGYNAANNATTVGSWVRSRMAHVDRTQKHAKLCRRVLQYRGRPVEEDTEKVGQNHRAQKSREANDNGN